MLENPTFTAPDPTAAVKRYAPPNQRNRSLNRRKSGERIDRSVGSYGIDGEKSQSLVLRSSPMVDHGEASAAASLSESSRHTLIGVEGCCRSEASQLLSNRWAVALHLYNDPSVDLSERPVLYSGSSESAWRNFRLPHQVISPTNNAGTSSGTQMDFLSELQRAMRSANTNFNN